MVELMAAYGTILDPWQVDVLEAGLGVRADGQFQAKTVGCNLARQQGKSVVLVARALAGALLFGEKVIVVSAHEQRTSRVLFRNIVDYFESYADLGRRVLSIGAALGREEIRLRDGTCLHFPARTRSTLRGWSVDCYLADEAQLLTDSQWESAKPAMAARPNGTAWMFGTAPQLSTDAEVLGRLRAAAQAGTDDRLAWVEYGAQPGADLDDREQWAIANPGRITLEAIEAERRELSPGGFARERLNIWPTERGPTVFDAGWWATLAAEGPPDGTAPAALAVDAGPDRTLAIAAAWRPGADRTHVELVAADRCDDPLTALQFVIDRAGRRVPVVIDGASAAASMVPALEAAGVKVTVTGMRDMGRACGLFLDDVNAGRISHANQQALTDAVDGARKRPLGDAGLFGWNRRDGGVFVAPLVAATLARFGAEQKTRRSGRATFC